jgi:hypothetical protein
LAKLTDDYRTRQKNFTEEIHFTGTNFDGKVSWLAGLYYLKQESLQRFYRWGMAEFSLDGFSGPNDPPNDLAARDYLRTYGALVGNPDLTGFNPLTVITDDALTGTDDEDTAALGPPIFCGPRGGPLAASDAATPLSRALWLDAPEVAAP